MKRHLSIPQNREPLLLALLILVCLFATSACSAIPSTGADGATTIRNGHSRVAHKSGDQWHIQQPPQLKFTGAVATGQQLRQWASDNGLRVVFDSPPDERFAQVEASSAIQAALWLKRFHWDVGYTYTAEDRDCDNFARHFRTFPDLFDNQTGAQACVISIYSTMQQPFAGIHDGNHALNVIWTDAGVYVFEPQGIDLTFQRLETWPNRTGISHGKLD